MPFVRMFLRSRSAPGCPACVRSRGRGSHQRSARPSLLTRPPTLSSNPQMHSFLSSSLLSLFPSCPPSPFFPSSPVSARQRMHRGLLFFALLFSSPPLSSFLFSFHVSPHRPPLLLARAACSLLISLSFSLPPFLRPSVLRSVSSHRISTSSFKECREARV